MKRNLADSDAAPPSLEEVKLCIEKRLFIGRLPTATTEDELRGVFGAYGTLTECRLIAAKGVAFVGYDSWATAHRALLATDGLVNLGSGANLPVAVCFAERTGSNRHTGAQFAKGMDHCQVLASGLPEGSGEQDVAGLFGVFGQVTAVQLLEPPGSRSPRALVTFALWGEALDAIEFFENQKLLGTPAEAATTTVTFAPPPGGAAWEPAPQRRRGGLAVASLQQQQSVEADQELENLKLAYGAAVSSEVPDALCHGLHAQIMALRQQRLGWGGGAAAPEPAAALPAAVLQGLGLPGGVQLNPPLPSQVLLPGDWGGGGGGGDEARLFVGGLPAECTDEDLRALVDQVEFTVGAARRQLLECRVLRAKGCGYVRFSSPEAALEAIHHLNDRAVTGWPTPLRVKHATPKGGAAEPPQRQQFQQQQLQQQQQQQQLVEMFAQSQSERVRDAAAQSALQALLKESAAQQAAAGAGQIAGLGANGAPQGAGAAAVSPPSRDELIVVAQGLDPRRLFVGQLTREFGDREAFSSLFEPFGQVESIRVLEEKGVAYVQFAEFEAANAALVALNGKHVPGISREQGLNLTFSKRR